MPIKDTFAHEAALLKEIAYLRKAALAGEELVEAVMKPLQNVTLWNCSPDCTGCTALAAYHKAIEE